MIASGCNKSVQWYDVQLQLAKPGPANSRISPAPAEATGTAQAPKMVTVAKMFGHGGVH